MDKFFTSLFDFSFRRFITPSLIKVVYILAIVGAGLSAIFSILNGFKAGVVAGIIALVIAPIVFIATVCFARIGLETILNIFRIANYAAEVARSTRSQKPALGNEFE